jgi:hypothetical protein
MEVGIAVILVGENAIIASQLSSLVSIPVADWNPFLLRPLLGKGQFAERRARRALDQCRSAIILSIAMKESGTFLTESGLFETVVRTTDAENTNVRVVLTELIVYRIVVENSLVTIVAGAGDAEAAILLKARVALDLIGVAIDTGARVIRILSLLPRRASIGARTTNYRDGPVAVVCLIRLSELVVGHIEGDSNGSAVLVAVIFQNPHLVKVPDKLVLCADATIIGFYTLGTSSIGVHWDQNVIDPFPLHNLPIWAKFLS